TACRIKANFGSGGCADPRAKIVRWKAGLSRTKEMAGELGKRRTVIVLATMDTKGEEAAFLRNCIENLGLCACLIDSGVVGEPAVVADISRNDVAAAGGAHLSSLLQHPTREVAA